MVRHHVLTLTGSVQALSTVTGALDKKIRSITLQPAGGNSGVIYVGDSITTPSSSDYGIRLEVPVTSIPPAPFVWGEMPQGWLELSEIRVIGTNNDKLHMLVDYWN